MGHKSYFAWRWRLFLIALPFCVSCSSIAQLSYERRGSSQPNRESLIEFERGERPIDIEQRKIVLEKILPRLNAGIPKLRYADDPWCAVGDSECNGDYEFQLGELCQPIALSFDPVNPIYDQENLQGFIDYCLRRPAATSDGDRSENGAKAEAAALETFGALIAGGDFANPKCLAVQVSNNRILTAAHCFESRWKELSKAYSSDNLYFHPASGAPIKVRKTGDLPWTVYGWSKGALRRDVISLELVRSRLISPPAFDRQAKAGDILFVPAVIALDDQQDQSIAASTFADRSRYLCRIVSVAVDSACFIHTCQTLPGVSGGPVYRIVTDAEEEPTGEVVLTGLHLGDSRVREEPNQMCGPESDHDDLQVFNRAMTIKNICNNRPRGFPACPESAVAFADTRGPVAKFE